MKFMETLICESCGNVWDDTLTNVCPNCRKVGINLNSVNQYKIKWILAGAIANKEHAREALEVARERLTVATKIKSRMFVVKRMIIDLETLTFGDQIKTETGANGIVLKTKKFSGEIIYAAYPSGALYSVTAEYVKRNQFISNKEAREFALNHQGAIDD